MSVALNWNEHPHLSLGFSNIRESDHFTDVVLTTEDDPSGPDGGEIHAHRVILAAASEFFRDVLFRDSLAKRPNPIIYLSDIRYRQLANIIEFIYAGKIELPENDYGEFVKVGERLKIHGFFGSEGAADANNGDADVPPPPPRPPRPKQEPKDGATATKRRLPPPTSASSQEPMAGPSGMKHVKTEGSVEESDTGFHDGEVIIEPDYDDGDYGEEEAYDEGALVGQGDGGEGASGGAKDGRFATNEEELKALIQEQVNYAAGCVLCLLCKKPLKHKGSIRRHFRQFHYYDNMVYKCPMCERTFSAVCNFQAHIYKLHPELKGLDYEKCKVDLG